MKPGRASKLGFILSIVLMIRIRFSRIVATVTVIVVFYVIAIKGVLNTTEVFKSCEGNVDVWHGYRSCIDVVFAKLIKNTGTRGNRYDLERVWRGNHCAGLSICYHDIVATECEQCLREADIKLLSECSNAEIARIQLHDCYLRYHNASINDE